MQNIQKIKNPEISGAEYQNGVQKYSLKKSHSNDALKIAGGTMQERSSVNLLLKQGRKCNRKLFKGDRSHIKKTAHRIIQGFHRSDKVLWNNIECFVFSRRERGYFNLQKLDCTEIHTDANVKGITLLERSNTFAVEPMRRGTFLSVLKNGVPATLAPNEGV